MSLPPGTVPGGNLPPAMIEPLLLLLPALASAPALAAAPAALAPSPQSPATGLTLVEDCNGNGIPDPEDIRLGISADCQGDWIPDECQTEVPFIYSYDDDEYDAAVGTGWDHIAFLTQYIVVEGEETITGVDIAWGSIPDGYPSTLTLWSDPDGDGDPTDAQPLVSVPVQALDGFTGNWIYEDIPDTYVGRAGSSFFVGIWGFYPVGSNAYPAGLDFESQTLRSWWISSTTPIVPDDLSSGGIMEFDLIGGVCACNGDWFLRPLTCDGGHCREEADVDGDSQPDRCQIDCDGDLLPDSYEIAQNPSVDCDGNGVLDTCEPMIDCDQNQIPDGCQATGQGLVGQYFRNPYLSGPFEARIDASVDFDFGLTSPLPGQIPSDLFSVRWTGSIFAPVTGVYTFALLHDDGGRLWVNGQLVVDDWETGAANLDSGQLELVGGRWYHLRLEYVEDFVSGLIQLQWLPPGGSGEVVPSANLRPIYDRDGDGVPDSCQVADCNGNGVADADEILSGLALDCDGNGVPDDCQPCLDRDRNGLLDACESGFGGGLLGQYFRTRDQDGSVGRRVAVRVDPQVDFDFGGGSPLVGLPSDGFAVRWSGSVTAAAGTGAYTLHIAGDDGVRLRVDGQLLIDEYGPSSGTEYSVTQGWVAGSRHLIEVDYFESGGDAEVHLRWTPPGGAKVAIPAAALSPDTDLNGDGLPDLYDQDCNENGILDALEPDLDGNCVPDDCDAGRAYYRFEEAGGVAMDDSSGSGVVGSLVAPADRQLEVPVELVPATGAANDQSLHTGAVSNSFGGHARVTDPLGALAMGDHSFTIEAWVRLDQLSFPDATDRQWLVQRKPSGSSDANLDFGLLVQFGGYNVGYRNLAGWFGDGSGFQQIVTTLRLQDTDWHHVSMAYDAERRLLRFGLDGQFEEHGFEKSAFAPSGPTLIGAHSNAQGTLNQFLRGSIDEVRITRAFLPPSALLRSR